MTPPRWIVARFGCCHECGAKLAGRLSYWWPRMQWAFCEACGRVWESAVERREQEENDDEKEAETV